MCGGGGVGKQVILRLTQSSGAGARTELGNNKVDIMSVALMETWLHAKAEQS